MAGEPFLSPPSARRATKAPAQSGKGNRISIPALREEGDCFWRHRFASMTHFYPRPPRGGRPTAVRSGSVTSYFYPRPPRGGRPANAEILVVDDVFLSPPSARRATRTTRASESVYRNFYPRPPRGGRPADRLQCAQDGHFYPRPPRGGRQLASELGSWIAEFLSPPSARRATHCWDNVQAANEFLSPPSARRATKCLA